MPGTKAGLKPSKLGCYVSVFTTVLPLRLMIFCIHSSSSRSSGWNQLLKFGNTEQVFFHCVAPAAAYTTFLPTSLLMPGTKAGLKHSILGCYVGVFTTVLQFRLVIFCIHSSCSRSSGWTVDAQHCDNEASVPPMCYHLLNVPIYSSQ
jgi:hypothetical protein